MLEKSLIREEQESSDQLEDNKSDSKEKTDDFKLETETSQFMTNESLKDEQEAAISIDNTLYQELVLRRQ